MKGTLGSLYSTLQIYSLKAIREQHYPNKSNHLVTKASSAHLLPLLKPLKDLLTVGKMFAESARWEKEEERSRAKYQNGKLNHTPIR